MARIVFTGWLGRSFVLLAFALVSSLVSSIEAAESKWTLRTSGVQPEMPPIPTIADSPVKFLSRLLDLSAAERAETLSRRNPERKAFWERKLREYETLPRPVREARLRVAQLHWYLALLIRTPEELRHLRLQQIPETDQLLVRRRMEQWDEFPPDLRSDILENIKVMQYFARLVSSSPAQREVLMKTSSQPSNPMNDEQVSWRTLPPQRRQEMFNAYAKFFELPRMKQEEAIAKIPVPTRKAFQERLNELMQMPLDERQRCLIALNVYANMSPEERTIFRGNAQRWRAMNEEERAFWTMVVKQLPPLPPMRNQRAKFFERRNG